jgi:phage terminase large subunit
LFKGLIYTPWPNAEVWPAVADETYYGLDFGFNNPSALVRVDEKDGAAYLTEKIYESGLTTRGIGERMAECGVSKRDIIYADAAEPDRIEELYRMGFNIHPADKGQGSVAAGILTVKAKRIYTRPENANLNREASTYKWAEDRDGRSLDVPVKINDHAMDAVRYALHTHAGKPVQQVATYGHR